MRDPCAKASGQQAARTLAAGADLGSSSTLASLVDRLDRGQLRLDDRSVVILDEAGMTDDIDLARLTTHAQLAGPNSSSSATTANSGPAHPAPPHARPLAASSSAPH